MNNKSIRVIFDTNLWISFLIGKQLIRLDSWLSSPNIQIIMSFELLDEIISTATRDKFRKYFPVLVIEELKDWILQNTEMFPLIPNIPSRCRDPKDDYLLELAIQANAIYLVSGDEDLLTLKQIENCKIMTIAQFEKEVEGLLNV